MLYYVSLKVTKKFGKMGGIMYLCVNKKKKW